MELADDDCESSDHKGLGAPLVQPFVRVARHSSPAQADGMMSYNFERLLCRKTLVVLNLEVLLVRAVRLNRFFPSDRQVRRYLERVAASA